jgi:DNA-binding MarR family transcriptional regulator
MAASAQQLTDQHLRAWRAVVTAHASVTERMQKAFAAADLPPLSWFDVLWAVHRSPTGRPRMSELAEWLTLSRGGITKLVDRLEGAGYIERVSCSEDRRSLQAELTPAGKRIVEEMREVYEGELGRYVGAVTAEEAEVLSSSLERVTGRTCDAEGKELDDSAEPAAVAASS